jgi:hypothetical protein
MKHSSTENVHVWAQRSNEHAADALIATEENEKHPHELFN